MAIEITASDGDLESLASVTVSGAEAQQTVPCIVVGGSVVVVSAANPLPVVVG